MHWAGVAICLAPWLSVSRSASTRLRRYSIDLDSDDYTLGQCDFTWVWWEGGVAPFDLVVFNADDPNQIPIQTWTGINNRNDEIRWVANVPARATYRFMITDDNGVTAKGPGIRVQRSGDSSCGVLSQTSIITVPAVPTSTSTTSVDRTPSPPLPPSPPSLSSTLSLQSTGNDFSTFVQSTMSSASASSSSTTTLSNSPDTSHSLPQAHSSSQTIRTTAAGSDTTETIVSISTLSLSSPSSPLAAAPQAIGHHTPLTPYIIVAACLGSLFLLTASVLFCCYKRRKRRSMPGVSSTITKDSEVTAERNSITCTSEVDVKDDIEDGNVHLTHSVATVDQGASHAVIDGSSHHTSDTTPPHVPALPVPGKFDILPSERPLSVSHRDVMHARTSADSAPEVHPGVPKVPGGSLASGTSDTSGDTSAEFVYELDGGVRLAGGPPGALADDALHRPSRLTLYMPPPYQW